MGWYWDYQIGNTYVCHVFASDAYGFGSNPTFQISYGWCPTLGANTWTLWFGGVVRKCLPNGTSGAGAITVGLETTGGSLVDRNIDVKYTNLKMNLTGSTTWNDFGNPGGALNVDPNYLADIISNTAENYFLPPLD